MRRYLQFLSSIVFSGLLFISCEKETVAITDSTVGISKIIFFPSLQTKGDRLIILKLGDTYTDAGATATLNSKPATFTTSGAVDLTKPGIYVLNYLASNEQGYTATDFRTVVIIGNDVTTHDYSGTYDRYIAGVGNGQNSTWTKTANGVYTVVSPGGATGVTATAVNYSGNNIAIPLQITSVGQFSSTGGVYNPTTVPPQYSWTIINSTYGATVRTFIKR